MTYNMKLTQCRSVSFLSHGQLLCPNSFTTYLRHFEVSIHCVTILYCHQQMADSCFCVVFLWQNNAFCFFNLHQRQHATAEPCSHSISAVRVRRMPLKDVFKGLMFKVSNMGQTTQLLLLYLSRDKIRKYGILHLYHRHQLPSKMIKVN
jgi:hypothetical protein